MFAVSRFDVPDGQEGAFADDARRALTVLAERPGFVRGRLGRAADEATTWTLLTEWDSVGSYRRGLSSYDVKLATAPLMAFSRPEPGAFEVVASVDDPRPAASPPSSRAR